MNVPDELFELYKPGTKPLKPVKQTEAENLKSLLISLVSQTEADLADGKFISFNERTTITGFHLGSLKDALEFNNYHEGLHLGYIRSICKFV